MESRAVFITLPLDSFLDRLKPVPSVCGEGDRDAPGLGYTQQKIQHTSIIPIDILLLA